jgi:hypothetical protein
MPQHKAGGREKDEWSRKVFPDPPLLHLPIKVAIRTDNDKLLITNKTQTQW